MKEYSIILNAKEHKRFVDAMYKKLNDNNMTRAELATQIGVAEKSIKNFESDSTRNPSKFLSAKIANYLGIEKKEYRSGGGFFLIPLALLPFLLIPIRAIAIEEIEVVRPVTYPITEVREIDHKAIENEVFGYDNGTDFEPGFYVAENEPITDYDLPISIEEQEQIQQICNDKDIPYEIVLGIIETESNFKRDVVSANGLYKGACQLDTRYHKCNDPFDLIENVDVATNYLIKISEDNADINYMLDVYSGNRYAQSNYEKGIISNYARKVTGRANEYAIKYGRDEIVSNRD